MSRSSAPTSIGSSPLARGLLPSSARRRRPGRIIPARAGFTRVFTHEERTYRDHPRSRGVYDDFELADWLMEGSSPLARGLRHWLTGRVDEGRIIPARAGFTNAQVKTMKVY